MKFALQLIFYSFAFLSFHAQDISGLWIINEVRVGNQNMTPTARWTHFFSDSSYTSGNGWQQNAVGTYHFNPETDRLSMQSAYGIQDEFEPFSVVLSGDEMVWNRNENGAGVTVLLLRADSLPMSPSDYLMGAWRLQYKSKPESGSVKKADNKNVFHFHFRPDGLYTRIESDGSRETGYWYMHGHRPELTLLPHNDKKEEVKWTVAADAKALTLKGNSGRDNTNLRFMRVHSLP